VSPSIFNREKKLPFSFSPDTAIIIASLFSPIIFLGSRLVTNAQVVPVKSSGVMCFAIPDTTCLISFSSKRFSEFSGESLCGFSPKSTESLRSFSDPSTLSAVITFPALISTFLKSSIDIILKV
jgi:hypothetical protein